MSKDYEFNIQIGVRQLLYTEYQFDGMRKFLNKNWLNKIYELLLDYSLDMNQFTSIFFDELRKKELFKGDLFGGKMNILSFVDKTSYRLHSN